MDNITTVDFELIVRGTITSVDAFASATDSQNGGAFSVSPGSFITPDARASEILTFGTGPGPNGDFAINGRSVGDLTERFLFDGVDSSLTAGRVDISFAVLQTTEIVDPFQRFFDAENSNDEFGVAIFDPVDTQVAVLDFDFLG
jgi:hypothetical protein